jgi:hypothetical protein
VCDGKGCQAQGAACTAVLKQVHAGYVPGTRGQDGSAEQVEEVRARHRHQEVHSEDSDFLLHGLATVFLCDLG